MPEFVKAAKVSQVPAGTVKFVELKGLRIAVYNLDGQYYATQDSCTHAEASLAEGSIDAGEIVCPWHGARFEIKTGRATCGPAYGDLATFPVRVAGDDLEIEV